MKLTIYLTSGNVIKINPKDYRIERAPDGSVTKYSFDFNKSDKNKLVALDANRVEAVIADRVDYSVDL